MTARPLSGIAALAAAAIVLLSVAVAARAEIAASIEPRIIDEFDTARLIIRAGGSNEPQTLDLQPLEADFEVLATQTSSQYRSVSGQVQAWVEYQITLRPRSTGELTIPAIQVGSQVTEPLRLHVRGLQPELREAIDRMVFFESELTTNPVYVQAQTVLIRRLYYSSGTQIYSDLPGLPEIANAIVMPLGETSTSTTIRDGQRYGVIEQRFAILPERSGELTIPAISITSSVRLQSGGRTRRSGVRIATKPVTVDVLPIPAEYPDDQPWLPAEDLELVDRWTPSATAVDVGEPLRRTLQARIRGNVSSAIAPLAPNLPSRHFREYPEPPRLEDETSGRSVRGLREETYAIVPTDPGSVTLPPTEVVWFDVRTEQVRTARAPGRGFIISGSALQRSAGPATDPGAAPQDGDEEASGPVSGVSLMDRLLSRPEPSATFWWWLAMTGLLLGAALLLLRGHLARPGASAEALARRARWQTLRTVCRGNDPAAVQHALLNYLQAHYQTSQTDACRQFRDAGCAAVLDGLNAARYGSNAEGAVSSRDVLDAVRDLRRRQGGRRRYGMQQTPLPALYD